MIKVLINYSQSYIDMDMDMETDIDMDMDMDMDMDIDMQCVQSQNSPIMVPKWSQDGPKMVRK